MRDPERGRGSASHLVFAGKVVNPQTAEWPNNRLVLLFLKDQEVGRAVTQLGESEYSDQGMQDGLFTIEIENTYKVIRTAFRIADETEPVMNRSGNRYYRHFDELPEGSTTIINMPEKKVRYTLKVIEGDVSTLPSALLTTGSTRLKEDGNIIVLETDGQQPVLDAGAVVQNVKLGTGADTVDISTITVPINNCGGSAKVIQRYVQSQTFIHEYRSEAEGGIGIDLPLPLGWARLMLELQARYGYEQGQLDTRTIDTTLEAAPGTNQSYKVAWKEIWDSGVGTVATGSDVIEIPFRVKTNVIYSLDSKRLNCN